MGRDALFGYIMDKADEWERLAKVYETRQGHLSGALKQVSTTSDAQVRSVAITQVRLRDAAWCEALGECAALYGIKMHIVAGDVHNASMIFDKVKEFMSGLKVLTSGEEHGRQKSDTGGTISDGSGQVEKESVNEEVVEKKQEG